MKVEFLSQIDQDEWPQISAFMERFFHYYYEKRNIDQICAMVDPSLICVGLQSNEVALNAEDFCAFVEKQMVTVSHSIQYHVVTYSIKPCGPHCWSCFYHVNLQVRQDPRCKVEYSMRLTATVRLIDGHWKFVLIHVSEAADSHADIRLPSQLTSSSGNATQEELDHLMSKLFPGCVIGITFRTGFPVLLANDQFLLMTGYSSIEEFKTSISGEFINCVAEEDRKLYTKSANFVLKTGKQCESNYRIIGKHHQTLWVHDTAQLVLTEDGQSILISSLLDISQQVALQNKLAIESGIDALTGIYNRNGAKAEIKKLRSEQQSWIFCVIDLDNFKLVNDLYGHISGDHVLTYVGQELNQEFSSRGVVFRLGGDEFGLYLSNSPDLNAVKEKISLLVERYRVKLLQECPDAQSTMSVGGIYGTGLIDPIQAYALADVNLYKVKNSTKDDFLFSPYQPAP